jgi:carbon-monoxide dehydrogenase medium subunit
VELHNGTIERAGIGLAAVGGKLDCHEVEEVLAGQTPSEELFAEAGRRAAAACSPTTDQRGSVEYKRHLAGVLTHRALRRATARALREEA